jgi:putative peptidoglycan lipid II flippase
MSRAIFKNTSVVGLTTLLSRVTGLLRDMVYSQAFGAGTLMDAFLVAFKIPNFLRRLFAEGAFSQSFVPVISEYKVRREQAAVKELVGDVTGTLGVVLFVVALLGVIAAPVIILLFAPGSLRPRASTSWPSKCCAGRFRTSSSCRSPHSSVVS